ncbi:hypothetical protein CNMCM7691_002378 [Aspergillus felis]|uniref:Uncharacterized protein n=1 Tax=Aspergillus felis TaxID=1287682 RepID=A0A8H6R2M0_9EURO|nr:hypothetical protein CNMCM7691_002378 [Aspergillus felis]
MSDYAFFTSTGCTFTGSPTPITATCSYSQSWHIGSHTVTRDETYVLPGTEVREILSATLTVAGTGPFPTGTAATATAATTNKMTATTNKMTGSTTGATVAGTSATGTTVSGNIAGRTMAPMMLMGAVVAGLFVERELARLAYMPQGLAALWEGWDRTEHELVQANVKAFLEATQKAYDLNRPRHST